MGPFVLRDGDRCHYADEDAIAPLWKGQRFPLEACISGWSMLNRQPVVIEDIYADNRIPHDAYRPTFVKSLVMVPIRALDPIGAIGNYWAAPHRATGAEVQLLQALANTTAVAMENVQVFTELEQRVQARTADLEAANRELLAAQQQADRVFAAYARAALGRSWTGNIGSTWSSAPGGFGVVFRGRHLILDCPVAIKVFRPVAGNDSALACSAFCERGRRGTTQPSARRSGARLRRVQRGVAFLIMELLQGRSLAHELATETRLSLRAVPPSLPGSRTSWPPPTTTASSIGTSSRRMCSPPGRRRRNRQGGRFRHRPVLRGLSGHRSGPADALSANASGRQPLSLPNGSAASGRRSFRRVQPGSDALRNDLRCLAVDAAAGIEKGHGDQRRLAADADARAPCGGAAGPGSARAAIAGLGAGRAARRPRASPSPWSGWPTASMKHPTTPSNTAGQDDLVTLLAVSSFRSRNELPDWWRLSRGE
jgi:hypothetical protein